MQCSSLTETPIIQRINMYQDFIHILDIKENSDYNMITFEM